MAETIRVYISNSNEWFPMIEVYSIEEARQRIQDFHEGPGHYCAAVFEIDLDLFDRWNRAKNEIEKLNNELQDLLDAALEKETQK